MFNRQITGMLKKLQRSLLLAIKVSESIHNLIIHNTMEKELFVHDNRIGFVIFLSLGKFYVSTKETYLFIVLGSTKETFCVHV